MLMMWKDFRREKLSSTAAGAVVGNISTKVGASRWETKELDRRAGGTKIGRGDFERATAAGLVSARGMERRDEWW